MKGFTDPNFLRAFARIQQAANPSLNLDRWTVGRVEWRRQRHNFWAADYAFQMEAHILETPGRRGWSLVVVIETWWIGPRSTTARTARWGKLIRGRKADALAWFKDQETRLPI